MENIEIWKDVLGYEGYYQISNLGVVKSLDRVVVVIKKTGNSYNKRLKKKILKTTIEKKQGYKTVILCKCSKLKTFRIHKLVAINFLNHIPQNYKEVVNHINFNKLDNNVSNLELISQRENANKKHLKSYSKYVGVSWHIHNKKWIANIYFNKKRNHLGYFKTEKEASFAYENFIKVNM